MKKTGVKKSHHLGEGHPPTTDTPSGRRDSPPAPRPRAMGSVPMSAAMVVIMIGRNLTRQPLRWLQQGVQPLLALHLEREVNHHDGVFVTMPMSMMIPTKP